MQRAVFVALQPGRGPLQLPAVVRPGPPQGTGLSTTGAVWWVRGKSQRDLALPVSESRPPLTNTLNPLKPVEKKRWKLIASLARRYPSASMGSPVPERDCTTIEVSNPAGPVVMLTWIVSGGIKNQPSFWAFNPRSGSHGPSRNV